MNLLSLWLDNIYQIQTKVLLFLLKLKKIWKWTRPKTDALTHAIPVLICGYITAACVPAGYSRTHSLDTPSAVRHGPSTHAAGAPTKQGTSKSPPNLAAGDGAGVERRPRGDGRGGAGPRLGVDPARGSPHLRAAHRLPRLAALHRRARAQWRSSSILTSRATNKAHTVYVESRY